VKLWQVVIAELQGEEWDEPVSAENRRARVAWATLQGGERLLATYLMYNLPSVLSTSLASYGDAERLGERRHLA